MTERILIFVCGLGRCGSSLVMQMLAAAGLRCPGRSPAFESAQWVVGDHSLPLDRYDAVKWLDCHHRGIIPPLPPYRVIFLTRDHRQQAESAVKYLATWLGMPSNRRDLRATLAHLRHDEPIARRVMGAAVGSIVLRFEDLLADPRAAAERISELHGGGLDVDAMAAVVVSRDAGCLPGMLEERLGAR